MVGIIDSDSPSCFFVGGDTDPLNKDIISVNIERAVQLHRQKQSWLLPQKGHFIYYTSSALVGMDI